MKRLVWAALPLLLAGCSDLGNPVEPSGGDPGDDPISFATDLRPILDGRCLSCHGASFPQGGLKLDEASSPGNLVGVESPGWAPALLVSAGDRDASVLYQKLEGNSAYGSQMPMGSSLSAGEIELFGRWIDEGAPDN